MAVHPRTRGERSPCAGSPERSRGSSPHARGTLSSATATAVCERFIPARAGNANTSRVPVLLWQVHPRTRGERPAVAAWEAHRNRFIPARAGNATCTHDVTIAISVHPRTRGERLNAGSTLTTRRRSGSSPHARGTLTAISRACQAHSVHPRTRGERRAYTISAHVKSAFDLLS